MLRQRILTALVLIPLLGVIVLLLPPIWTVLCLAALVLAGAWEWSAFPGFASPVARTVYVVAVAALMWSSWRLTATGRGLDALLLTAIVWWTCALLWIVFAPTRVGRLSAALAGVLVLVPAWTALVRLQLSGELGPILVLFLLVLVWAADIGAYFAGRSLGRIKLAPRVSPGKTWEGVMGGVIAGLLVAVPAGLALGQLPAFLALCLGIVLASVVGDLTESLFKRFAGLKDSGALFPGHGGVLDRIDSVTAAAPFFLLGLGWLGIVR
jgi:phosphatidate cytidylyltransferase